MQLKLPSSKLLSLFIALLLFVSQSFGQVYSHSFTTGAVSGSDYTTAPDVLATGLSVGSPQWTGSGTTAITNCSGNSNLAVNVPNVGSTRTLTLTLNVAAAYTLNLTGISTKIISAINNGGYSITVNGNAYYSSSSVLNACPGTSITQNTPMALTGTVTIVVSATNSGTSAQNFAIDDFVLNGTLTTSAVYFHQFSTGSVVGSDYTTTPDVLGSNITVGSPQWTGSGTTAITNCSGNNNLAVSVPNAGSTRSLTLRLNVASGYALNLTGISTKIISSINNGGYSITINGNGYYSSAGTLNACPGVTIIQNTPLTLTGTVTIVVAAINSGSSAQNFAIDDFTLNGSTSLMTLDKLGLGSTLASAAYSLRLLNSNYTGPLVRIAIGSNFYDVYPDVTTDKAFSLTSKISAAYSTYNATATGSTANALSTVITSGVTNATGVIWYDQTGNGNDAYQAASGNQPKLISAGTIITSSSKPSFQFTSASTHSFQTTNNISLISAASTNAVSQAISAGASSSAFVALVTQNYAGTGQLSGTLGRNGTSTLSYGVFTGSSWQNSSFSSDYPTTPFITTGTYGGTSLNLYVNGKASTTSSATASMGVSRPLIIGKRWDLTDGYNGYIGEVVVFNSTLSQADRQAIEASQGSYYAIGVYSTNTDAHLSALTSSAGTLTPSFDSSIATYNMSVSNATTSTTITPTVFINGATVKVNNVATTSGNASSSISLNVGANNIPVVVTALDGTTTKTYTVTVTRAASTVSTLSNLTLSTGILNTTFASGTTSYTATVSNATSSITVTPTVTDATSTVKVNTVSVVSGNASSAINLAVGTNTITVVGTAQDGITTTTYTITVTRLAADVVYYHSFSTGSLTGNDYTTAPDVLSSNLTVGTPQWTGVNGTTFCAGNGGLSVSVPNIGSTRTMTLVLNVANGYKLNLSGISFKENSTINNGGYGVKVNGTGYASSSSVQNACPGVTLSGSTTLSLTGTVTIEVYGTNSGSGTQTLSIDDFTINGSFTTTSGNALHFDGVNDKVTIADAATIDVANTYTIEAWINPSSFNALGGIVSKNNVNGSLGYTLRLAGTAPYSGINFDGLETPTSILQTGKWYHIAAVNNAGTRSIYINGVQQSTTGSTFTVVANTDPLTIGVDYLASPRYFNGSIDEVKLYNTALTAAQIQTDMFSTSAVLPANVAAYYSFNLGTAGGTNTGITSLLDQSTNANTGTLTGFALAGAASNWIASTIYNTWVGATSSAYGTASNWDLGIVPTTSDNIVIPTGASNLPVTVTTAQGFLNGQIQTSASLTNTNTLSIAGNLFNSGTITSTAGTIAYTGASAQTISASTFTSNTLQGLTINNPAGVTLGGALTVSTVLTSTAGTFNTGGYLTLASTASGTARVASSTGVISGNTTVQRYIPGGRRVFRFLAHPFTSNLALSNLTDNIDITGAGGAPMTTTATNNPSAFSYDNSIANSSLSNDPGWTALTASSTWNAKSGYRVLVRGSKAQSGSLTSGTYTPDAVTLDWTGVLNQGDQTVTLANNGTNKDFTFVGNPYASPVDLSLVTRGSNINANFSVWNANAGARGAYVTQPFSTSYILPSGAAFFTQAAANTSNTITFTEASKSSGTPTLILGNNADNTLTIEVQDSVGNYADKLGFYFNDQQYTANNDVLWDAVKMTNPDVNFYSFSKDNTKLAIDRRPLSNETIALGFTAPVGSYTLLVKELPVGSTYYLKDNYLGTTTLLSSNESIKITINADSNSYGANRLSLVSKVQNTNTISASMAVAALPNPVVNTLNITYNGLSVSEPSVITLYAVDGKAVTTINLGNVQSGYQQVDVKTLSTGVYTIKLTNGVNVKSVKVIKK